MSTLPNNLSDLKSKITKLASTQVPIPTLLNLIIGFLSIVLITLGAMALWNINSEEENIKKTEPKSVDCINSNLRFQEVLSTDDLVVREAKISEDCIYSPSLVKEYNETQFNIDYEVKKKYTHQPKDYYSDARLKERAIEFGNILFRQYAPENTFYLTDIEILLDGELVLEDRINTITCSAVQQTSYTITHNTLYLAYYSGTLSKEGMYEGVKYSFYKVDSNGLVDLLEDSDYSSVNSLFNMNDKLLYFYEKTSGIEGLNYGGEEILNGEYEYIENACSCQPAAWKIKGNQRDEVIFFAHKEEEWFKVVVEIKGS